MRVIGDLSRANARRRPQKTALVQPSPEGERSLTYGELDARSDRLAHALHAWDVGPGERVAVLAHNCVEYAVVSQGVAKAGAMLTPLNHRLGAAELTRILDDAQPAVIVSEHACAAVLGQALARHPNVRLIMLDAAAGLAGAVTLDALLAAHPARAPQVPVDPESACAIVYTSGTTGAPKGVMLSHAACFRMYMATAIETGLRHEDVFLMAAPMYHLAGLNMMLHQALFLGATGVVHRGSFDPARILPLIERYRITMAVLVPTTLAALAQHAQRARHDLSSWRMAFYGSMPMPPRVLAAARQAFPQVAFHQLYGSTEAGMLTVLTWADHAEHAHCTGREALLSEVRVVDDAGRDVPVGAVGEVIGGPATAMLGYWRNDEATRVVRRADGWIRTGDRARREPGGFITLVGRIQETIVTGGEKVYPTEVERVLGEHPAVREVAVLGLPDARFGESVCAVLVPRPGERIDFHELDALCRSRLAGYKRPRRYEIVAALPRNASDKVDKGELRLQFINDTAERSRA